MNLRNASFIKENTEESKHKDMSGTEQKKKEEDLIMHCSSQINFILV